MTYLDTQCNSDCSHFLLFHHTKQAHSMLEIWIDHFNNTKVRMVEDKPNQQFETMTYLHNQCNFVLRLMIHFLHLHKDTGMLEMWMNHDNNTKVRMVADKSYQHLKRMTCHLPQCNSDRSHFLHFLHLRQASRMLEIWMDHDNAKRLVWQKISHISIWKEWLTIIPNATLIAHTSYISTIVTKPLACYRFELTW